MDADIRTFLKEYDGPDVNIMEVCGSHTAAIAREGIRSMVSDKIHLIAGPGCPVCVTASAYIDRLIELSYMDDTTVVTFGDMIRIPGSRGSLRDAAGCGAHMAMVYSPLDMIEMAAESPEREFVFAAVGFETTAPAYALLLEQLMAKKMTNVRLLTAVKLMTPVIDWLCRKGPRIDGFIAPGHVSVITGSDAFVPAAEKFSLPFAVAGFEGEDILAAIYWLLKSKGKGRVVNLYPEAVKPEGNVIAREKLEKFFEAGNAAWRGMGTIDGSGLYLREEFSGFDAGSRGLDRDSKYNEACMCGKILAGRAEPADCPLFKGGKCTPQDPQGACMVSFEGNCYQSYINGEQR